MTHNNNVNTIIFTDDNTVQCLNYSSIEDISAARGHHLTIWMFFSQVFHPFHVPLRRRCALVCSKLCACPWDIMEDKMAAYMY